MTLRNTPPVAAWILNQFGSLPENESAIGDLIEKYQRGRGAIWYWRQALAIVFRGLHQEFRRNTGKFLSALIRTWCVWTGLNMAAGFLLMKYYRSLHQSSVDLTANVLPLVTLRVHEGNKTELWEVNVLLIALNILTLLLVGRYVSVSSQIHPQRLLLACITFFVTLDISLIATGLLFISANHSAYIGFLITDLIALPLVPALLLIGGIGRMRKLSRRSLKSNAKVGADELIT